VNAMALPQLDGRPMVTDGAGLMLESATWRANPDWGDRLGYSPADLARVNRDAISMLAELRERYRDDLTQLAGDLPALAIVGGCCGTDARHVEALWNQPRGD
jgi:S-methylmethionine-dependent homocysteine/selenocysteine methylase